MWELAFLVVAAIAGWLVFDALRAREAAIRIAKAACREQQLQFLDDTVRCVRTRFARDGQGQALLRRTFVFEFSEDGVSRRSGNVVMLGGRADTVLLEPYRLV